MIHCTGSGKRATGTKMPLNRNIGITSSPITMSKSCTLRANVVRQIAIAENAAADEHRRRPRQQRPARQQHRPP